MALVCLAGLTGCGGPNDRAAISGAVAFADGRPIASGRIEFAGLDQAMVTGAMIEAGKYHVPRAKGLKVGKYRVRINAADTDPSATGPIGFPGEHQSKLPVELIPPRYNRDSQLEVTVSDTNDQTFDFTIETK